MEKIKLRTQPSGKTPEELQESIKQRLDTAETELIKICLCLKKFAQLKQELSAPSYSYLASHLPAIEQYLKTVKSAQTVHIKNLTEYYLQIKNIIEKDKQKREKNEEKNH